VSGSPPIEVGHGSPVHRLDARVKLVVLVGLAVVSATTPVGLWWAFAGYLAVLVALCALARLRPLGVLRRMTVELPFLAAAAVLPLVADDGARLGATVALKVTVGVLAMVVLSSTTPFPSLLDALRRLRVPATIVLVVGFLWRYLEVMVEEYERGRVARAARGYRPRWLGDVGPAARGVATLFVRSMERGERVYLAMLARGYSGGAVVLAPTLAVRRTDLLGGTAVAAAVLGARFVA
jgi:cobalt/nickel transport system permease protein